jgi:two-component system cell cycle sensor histidine kinase/response regulator CckA
MRRILIVDDNETNLYLLRALLQGHGYTVEEARNGAAALEAARGSKPDLIISDLLMPVLDGYALLRKWKADEGLKDVPFVVYTATYTDPRDERLALSLGADAFILKPSEPEPFMARVEAVLAKSESGDLVKGGAAKPFPEAGGGMYEAQTEVLIRKLEKKAVQLEQANGELLDEIVDRRRAEEGLRQSEERFRELAETIQEIFWMTDPGKTRMIYVSPAYERVWGRSSASLYQTPADWIDSIVPEDRERVREAALTRQVRGDYDETFRIRRPDGTVRWIRDRAYPVCDAQGNVVRVVGTAEDITDRRRLEEQYRTAQKMEAMGQLAAGVAHDFNNIIAVILGYAELAQAQIAKGATGLESLAEIAKAGERAKDLVHQVLTFSRQGPQKRKVIRLETTLRETVNFLAAVIPPEIKIEVDVEPEVPAVLADATQIHQVIANLGANAWHAMEGKPGRIDVRLQSVVLDVLDAERLSGIKPGRVARLTVADSGKGMEAGILERIFDPFFTTKAPGKGTGLGLSVVQGIVQGHDGAITVTSQPGRGTTFQVYLPAAVEAEAPLPAAPVPATGKGRRILYLDDEQQLTHLATRTLEGLGYSVTGHTKAAEALRAFRENPSRFDLVITDLNMPGPSGLQVAAEFLKVRPGLPVVLCSGHVTEELRQRAGKAGIREVLFKPGTMEEFGEAIHRIIDTTLKT